MLGFLKPGLHVGIEFAVENPNANLYIFAQDDYEIAKVISKWQPFTGGHLDASAKKILEPYRTKIEAYTRHMGSSQLNSAHQAALMRTSFGKIVAIGRDYVLLEIEQPVRRREVISRSVIGRLVLDAAPIEFLEPETPSAPGGKQQITKP